MAIPNGVIQEILEKSDIVDIVSRYVSLKRSGSSVVGLCPFHSEKTPSFHVSPEKQLYYCFGCQNGGTVINFIMQMENLDFVEAVKLLGSMVGVEVPDNADFDSRKADLKKRLYLANAEAGRFFYRCLGSKEGSAAKQYLAGRGLKKETVTKFGIGYAPSGWDGLLKHLKAKGFSEYEIVSAGLAVRSEKKTVYDRFRGRIMFPIFDVRGNVIAFGGRVLDDTKPKYLNTSDTPVFDKSANLFGLNLAKNSRSRRMVVVEGYMDVVTLHQHGVDTAIASLGTAFTQKHAKLLKRYADEVVLCYDSDEAGRNAAQRAMEILSHEDLKTKVIAIRGAKDPDEYCKKYGAEGFFSYIDKAEPPILYKIGILKEKYDLKIPEQKVDFLKAAAEELVRLPSDIEREVYGKEIAAQTGVSYETVQMQVRRRQAVLRQKDRQKEKRAIVQDLRQKTVASGGAGLKKETECKLLRLMFYSQKAYQVILKESGLELFSDELYQSVAKEIVSLRESGVGFSEPDLISRFEIEQAGKIAEILSRKDYFEDDIQGARELIAALKQCEIKDSAADLARSGKMEQVRELLKKRRAEEKE